MSYVFDSSSLIYLGKARLLEKTAGLEGRMIIPASVYEEVVGKGLERGEPEARYIEALIKRKMFLVKKASKYIGVIPLLSKADTEVLSLAKDNKAVAIIDELYGREVAEAFGIKSHGSLYLLLMLAKKGIITKREAMFYLDEMVRLGFFLSAEKYKEVLDKIRKL